MRPFRSCRRASGRRQDLGDQDIDAGQKSCASNPASLAAGYVHGRFAEHLVEDEDCAAHHP